MSLQGRIRTYLGFLGAKPKQAPQRCLRGARLLLFFFRLLLLGATDLPKASSLQQSNREFRQPSQAAPFVTNTQPGCAEWRSSLTYAVSASVECLLLPTLLLQTT